MTFDYSGITPITASIPEDKRTAKRYYGKHQYFTTRAWNVVQDYIKHYSRTNDTVLDPFGGSGVTAIEALILGRRGIHVDISPLSVFLAKTTAYSPVDTVELGEAFTRVESRCKKTINKYFSMNNGEVEQLEIQHWYPKDIKLPSNADVTYVHELFTPRQLISLALIYDTIMQEPDTIIRELLRLTFSATLIKTNRTFVSAKGRKPSRGGAAFFNMYRYYVPPQPVELNVWEQFEMRFGGIKKAKEETNIQINDKYKKQNFVAINGSATELHKYIDDNSVDYIFTDPPYGAHIAYLDLSTIFHAWLQLDVSDSLYEKEAIEGGDKKKSQDDYFSLMEESFEEMFRVLKYDRWVSVVFAHKDISYWNGIIKGAQRSGFEYVVTTSQAPQTVWSMHNKKNPLKTLAGNMILTFRKVQNPRTIAITNVGADAIDIMKNTAELVIVKNDGAASTDKVVNEIIMKLLENGLLAEVKTKVGDIAPILQEFFIFNEIEETWQLPKNISLGKFIPLDKRIRFYLIDYFKNKQRKKEPVTFGEIVQHVLPELINGETPDNETILDILEKIAIPVGNQYWKLIETSHTSLAQTTFFDEENNETSLPRLIAPATEKGLTHNSIIYRLAKLGKALSYNIWVGKREQVDSFNGEKLADLSLSSLPIDDFDEYSIGRISQIDLIWFNSAGLPSFAFEIEHTTTIKSGIERFVELVKYHPAISDNLVIFVPSKRKKKLIRELTKSAFVGHPLYMENKIRYGIYTDLVKMYDNLSQTNFRSSDIDRNINGILSKVHQ